MVSHVLPAQRCSLSSADTYTSTAQQATRTPVAPAAACTTTLR